MSGREMDHEYFYKYWKASAQAKESPCDKPSQGSDVKDDSSGGSAEAAVMSSQSGAPWKATNDCQKEETATTGLGRGRDKGKSLPSPISPTPDGQLLHRAFNLELPKVDSPSSSSQQQSAANSGPAASAENLNKALAARPVAEAEDDSNPEKIKVVIGRSTLLDTFLPLEPMEKDLEEVTVTFSYPTAAEVRERRRKNPGQIKPDDDLREACFLVDLKKYLEKKKARRERLELYVAKNSMK